MKTAHADGLSDTAANIVASELRVRRIGIAIVAVVFIGFGAWAVLAPLSSAAQAPGVVTVDNYRKTVQHLEGGIIKTIAVRDGQRIERNQVLITLDDTQSRGQFEVVRGQYYVALAREARLQAQRDGLPKVSFPPELLEHAQDPRIRDGIDTQLQTFRVRDAAYRNEAASYRQEIEQLRAQTSGMRIQKLSRERLVSSFQGELTDFQQLLTEGYAEKQKVRELERSLAESEAQLGELVSKLASAEFQMTETNLKILQLQKNMQREVAEELAKTQAELNDLREKMLTLQSTLARTVIRAPYAGVVINLGVHALGGVISPGEKLMDIVPKGEKLVVSARVSPMDIDRVHVGQSADIRFPAFKTRTTPKISGLLVTISADRLVDPGDKTGNPYYLADVEISKKGRTDLLKQKLVLVAGMPAEVMIKTGERSLFNYLLDPLRNAAASAFTEE